MQEPPSWKNRHTLEYVAHYISMNKEFKDIGEEGCLDELTIGIENYGSPKSDWPLFVSLANEAMDKCHRDYVEYQRQLKPGWN